MRFATYHHPGEPRRLGVLANGLIHGCLPEDELPACSPTPAGSARPASGRSRARQPGRRRPLLHRYGDLQRRRAAAMHGVTGRPIVTMARDQHRE